MHSVRELLQGSRYINKVFNDSIHNCVLDLLFQLVQLQRQSSAKNTNIYDISFTDVSQLKTILDSIGIQGVRKSF